MVCNHSNDIIHLCFLFSVSSPIRSPSILYLITRTIEENITFPPYYFVKYFIYPVSLVRSTLVDGKSWETHLLLLYGFFFFFQQTRSTP